MLTRPKTMIDFILSKVIKLQKNLFIPALSAAVSDRQHCKLLLLADFTLNLEIQFGQSEPFSFFYQEDLNRNRPHSWRRSTAFGRWKRASSRPRGRDSHGTCRGSALRSVGPSPLSLFWIDHMRLEVSTFTGSQHVCVLSFWRATCS